MFTPDAVATNPPVVFYLHTDHIDTPRVVVDKNNAIRWRWMSEPFGTTAPETNPSGLGVFTQPLRMPGMYFDQESGLFYNMTRSLDTTTNRYSQFDSIGLAGGINGYAYVFNNPLSFVDPDGRQAQALPIIIPGLVVGCYLSSGCRDLFKPRPPAAGPLPPDAPPQATPIPPSKPLPIVPASPSREKALCEAEALQDKIERDALCFIAKARGGKGAQARCLSESDQIYREALKKCEKTCP